MIRLRAALSLMLSVLLALSPVGMVGMGMAASPGGAVVELCGSGPVLLVGQPGPPKVPGHDMECPVCLAHHATAVLPDVPALLVPVTSQKVPAPRSPVLAAALPPALFPQARAPPVLI